MFICKWGHDSHDFPKGMHLQWIAGFAVFHHHKAMYRSIFSVGNALPKFLFHHI